MDLPSLGRLAEQGVGDDQIIFLIPESVRKALLQIRQKSGMIKMLFRTFVIAAGDTFHQRFFVIIPGFHALNGAGAGFGLDHIAEMKIKIIVIFHMEDLKGSGTE